MVSDLRRRLEEEIAFFNSYRLCVERQAEAQHRFEERLARLERQSISDSALVEALKGIMRRR
jgi:hypothetical protein